MTMRVVVVHNRYRSANPSGENKVVDADVDQLRADGLDVITYFRDSDEISEWGPVKKASLAVRPAFSLEDHRAFRELLERTRPDVVHLHNPYPLISPAIIRVAKRLSIPIVQTVHNYRHSCVNGLHFRDGAICTECEGLTLPWPAVTHGCYQGSRAGTLPMAMAQVLHRRTWTMVDCFLPVGEAVADNLLALGVEPARVRVRPNQIADPGGSNPLGSGVLYVGRLSEEKGVEFLLDAWASIPDLRSSLTIAGTGPLVELVRTRSMLDERVRQVGYIEGAALSSAYSSAALVVVPSLCFEAHPVALLTAQAHGRAVLAVASAATRACVSAESGWLSEPRVDAFARLLVESLSDRPELVKRGLGARRAFLQQQESDQTTLLEIYENVVHRAQADAAPGQA